MHSVAIQGATGSYSEEAAVRFFGQAIHIQGFSSFFETFRALLAKSVDYAVVPVKNTIIGEISATVQIFNQTDLRVHDQLSLDIDHVLVGTQSSVLGNIRNVTSHDAALGQCKSFFDRNRQIKKIVGADTGSSIRRVVVDDLPENAAIGSCRAAEIYGGKILLDSVANENINQTTFYLIGS